MKTAIERAMEDLARLQAGMAPEVAAYLGEAFKANDQAKADAPRVALRAACEELRSKFERGADGVWAKRATVVAADGKITGVAKWNYYTLTGDIDGDGDLDFACVSCLSIQPDAVCSVCKAPGPGNCCWACGTGLCYGCPTCGAAWRPIAVEELDEAGGMRTASGVVEGCRTEKGFGIVRMIVNSDEEDDYGTVLLAKEIASKIVPGETKIDVEHQRGSVKGYIEGAECASVDLCKVPWKGKMVESVVTETRMSLKVKRSEWLYGQCSTGKLTSGSVLFTYPKAVDEAIKAKRTKIITPINKVPAYTFTAQPSNPVSFITECRTSRFFMPDLKTGERSDPVKVTTEEEVIAKSGEETPPATETPKVDATKQDEVDPLADLRKAVGASEDGAGVTPPPNPDAPASSAPADQAPADAVVPPAGGAPEPTLTSLSEALTQQGAALKGLTDSVEQMRSSPVAAGLATVTGEVEDLRTKLAAANTLIEGQRTLIKETIGLVTMATRSLQADIAKLRVAPPRKGHSGTGNAELEEGLRTIGKQIDSKTKEEKLREDLDFETERLARLSTGSLA